METHLGTGAGQAMEVRLSPPFIPSILASLSPFRADFPFHLLCADFL